MRGGLPPRACPVLCKGVVCVGKTTCAAAAVSRMARAFPSRTFLLLSSDPAHSLLDSLAGDSLPGNVEVREFDAAGFVQRFRGENLSYLREIALRGTFLDEADVGQLLDLSLPGIDESFPLLELAGWGSGGGHDCVVVDTAPSGHTLRLLTMPGFFRHWLDALDALMAKHRYMRERFGGSEDHLDDFIVRLRRSVDRLENLLSGPEACRFVPVMQADSISVFETASLLRTLDKLEISAAEVIVNRLLWDPDCVNCARESARQWAVLEDMAGEFPKRGFWGVPRFPFEVRGRERLDAFMGEAAPLRDARSRFFGVDLEAHPWPSDPLLAENPAPLPPSSARLVIFAGKGGAGKTTLACAAAVRLARAGGRRVLLFSTDPAHTLGACLQVAVGPSPVEVEPNLFAMEMDADAELQALRNAYRQDLSEFFSAALGEMDLAFDREVLERLMDLTPPGLDEIMSLLRILAFMDRREYDIFVLDSAPTGHLVRLLELPELMTRWVGFFMGLFAKYRSILRLPGAAARLARMGRSLRQLKKLLRDPARTRLLAVSHPTLMCLEETRDLVETFARMGIHIPALFLNLVTPEERCLLCECLCREEAGVLERFRETFPDVRRTLVYLQPQPTGLERLGRLGEAAFE